DLSTSPYVDIAGARLLREVQGALAASGAILRLVEARSSVRDLIRKEVGPSVGEVSRRMSVDDAVTTALSASST
ncbi:MAG TPA: DNA repair protein, partial [Casimicrobiaceae bacterium]